MKVAVIGSSGGMGKLFARYFIKKGCTVFGYDLRKRYIKGLIRKESSEEAVREADLTIIATPLGTETAIASKIRDKVREKSYVIEISSIKGEKISVIKKLLNNRSTLISLHPLFGPRTSSLKGKKIIVLGDRESAELVEKFFPEAKIIISNEREHDRMMGLVLNLPYVLNAAYLAIISRHSNNKRFNDLLTPTALKQIELAEKVVCKQPSLFTKILLSNPASIEYLRELEEETRYLREVIESNNLNKLLNFVRHSVKMFGLYQYSKTHHV